MTNKIGYATTAVEAQAIRDTAKCIVLVETDSSLAVLKSIAQSLRTQDVFIGDTNNPAIRPFVPLLESAGVVIQPRTNRPTSTTRPFEGVEPGSNLKESNKRPQVVENTKIGRPRAWYINDDEIVHMRDKEKMTFREISDFIQEREGVPVHVSQVHSAYKRATRTRKKKRGD